MSVFELNIVHEGQIGRSGQMQYNCLFNINLYVIIICYYYERRLAGSEEGDYQIVLVQDSPDRVADLILLKYAYKYKKLITHIFIFINIYSSSIIDRELCKKSYRLYWQVPGAYHRTSLLLPASRIILVGFSGTIYQFQYPLMCLLLW